MNALESVTAHCPYCGEPFDLLVDCTLREQDYVEDCPVCCRPIDVAVRMHDPDGLPEATLRRQDEA